ncbi:MAG TPA: YbaK/EbsC family protein, partial [Candidatus Babeliaceae bacterium]|nr:YbaK/EbsC family protein [Candidatus Babeliaceae bacterium]
FSQSPVKVNDMNNNQVLSRSVQSVQKALDHKGIKTRVLELPSSTRTAQDAANTIGCTVDQIVKSLIFKTKDEDEPILVLASGPNRVNETMIETVLGKKIIKADANFVKEMTGFAIGGIPPIGHKQPIRTFIDQDLLKFKDLWAAAGTPNAVFCLTNEDLTHLTNGTIIAIY